MSERKPIEVEIGGKTYRLLGALACAIINFRKPEDAPLQHIAILDDEMHVIGRGFNNPELCSWMSGIHIETDDDGDLVRYKTVMDNQTFRQEYGWTPIYMEYEEASDEVREAYIATNTEDIDEEWGKQE